MLEAIAGNCPELLSEVVFLCEKKVEGSFEGRLPASGRVFATSELARYFRFLPNREPRTAPCSDKQTHGNDTS
jgi:hypothetical protein